MIRWLWACVVSRRCLVEGNMRLVTCPPVYCERMRSHPGPHRCDIRDGWPFFSERIVFEWEARP